MGQFENNILQAIDIIVNKSVADAGYDRTIQAVIVECVDKTIGQYKVKHQDSIFYAYAENTDTTYSKGSSVYVLVPSNDMSKDKRILGTTKKLGINYIPVVEDKDLYDTVGKNCVEQVREWPGLHSYYKDGDAITLYSKASGQSYLNVNATDVNEYIKNANYLKCGIQVETALAASQQYRGNYGIIFSLNFIDNATGATVTRDYVIDVDKMIGNPYKLVTPTEQYAIFEIDGANFVDVQSIIIFSNDFPCNPPVENPPADIFIRNVEMSAAEPLSASDVSNYSLSIITPQGTYFDDNDIDQDVRRLEAQLRVKGSVVNYDSQSVAFYWFVQSVRVTINSQEYNKYGGQGWKCLNNYNIIEAGAAGEPPVVEWIPGSYVWEVKKSDVIAKEVKYKCVAIYDNSVISKVVTIKNLSSPYDITVVSDAGTQFYFDIGHPTLTCLVNGAEAGQYTYAWAVTDSSGTFQTMPTTPSENAAYNALKAEYDALATSVANETAPAAPNQAKLADLENQLSRYNFITRVEGNKVHDIQINTIVSFSTYQCSVYNGDVYLGTAGIILRNNLNAEGAYHLVLNDADYVYKYNYAGVSPASPTVEHPISIKALTFTVFDNLGNPIDDDIIEHSSIKWIVPTVNTMIEIPSSYHPTVVGVDTATYSNLMSLSYDIKDRYNISYNQNTITLAIDYKGISLTAQTNFTFTKEGEPGTNGTDFLCKIVPVRSVPASTPQWQSIYPIAIQDAGGNRYWNVDPGSASTQFQVQLWHNERNIFTGSTDGTSLEGKQVSRVTWEIPLNTYRVRDAENETLWHESRKDVSAFQVLNPSQGTVLFNGYSDDASRPPVNILKCTICYDGVDYTATLPIISVRLSNNNYTVKLKDYTGFRFAIYASDGRHPTYDRTNPFTLVTQVSLGGGVWEDVSEKVTPTYAIDYTWSYIGQPSDDMRLADNNSITVTRAQKAVRVLDDYRGESKSNAIVCVLTHGAEVARIHIPVHLYLDRYGNAALNGWDGNSVVIDDVGGVILTPQIGAGIKEEDNSFTGVVMGEVRENYGETEVGFFGYEKGERTIFLDAKTGKSEFGKRGYGQIVIDPSSTTAKIYSGEFYRNGQETGEGLLIDLSAPEIRYGNGNFWVNAQGELHSVKGSIGGWTIGDNYLSAGSMTLHDDGSITGPGWSIDSTGLAHFNRIRLDVDPEHQEDTHIDLGLLDSDYQRIILGDFIIRMARASDGSTERPCFFSLYSPNKVDDWGNFDKSLSGISATITDILKEYWLWAGYNSPTDMAFGVQHNTVKIRKELELTGGNEWAFRDQKYTKLSELINAINTECNTYKTAIDSLTAQISTLNGRIDALSK